MDYRSIIRTEENKFLITVLEFRFNRELAYNEIELIRDFVRKLPNKGE